MSTAPLFRRILLWEAVLAVAIAVVGGGIAWMIGGGAAAGSALLGALLSFVFAGATAASILLGGRLARGDMLHPAFFGVIAASFLLKLIVFFVILLVLGRQQWIVGTALVATMFVSVLGGLAIDTLVISRSRLAREIDVVLPGETSGD